MEPISRLRAFDVYPKVNEDFYKRTLAGGLITIVSTIVMTLLFFSELGLYLNINTENELFVDTSRGETLQINLDVTFPHMGCSILSLDAMDISGDQHLDVVHNVYKRRLSADGTPIDEGTKHIVGEAVVPSAKTKDGKDVAHNDTHCGSCYGSEEKPNQCCNTCDEVREAYRKKGWAFNTGEGIEQCIREGFITHIRAQAGEGCNVYGYLEVNKVAGNFHFAPGKSFSQANMHVHDLMPFQGMEFNVSHVINKLSFGADFPGVRNPLDGVVHSQMAVGGMHQYFIKVVPTIYTDINNNLINTNQFSVTEHFRPTEAGGRSLPGVFFFYDLSPIKVTYTEHRSSFLHFLTNVCAIVGGVFTVSGIIDSFVYHGHQAIKKKMELGKLS
eukprot:jgi/Chlat1/8456/Chrsp80S07865